MSTSVDLMTLGMPDGIALRLGLEDLTLQQASTSIRALSNNIVAVTEVGAASFTFNSDTEIGRPMWVANLTPETCLLRPANYLAGGKINGQDQVSITQFNSRVVIRLETNRWVSFLTS